MSVQTFLGPLSSPFASVGGIPVVIPSPAALILTALSRLGVSALSLCASLECFGPLGSSSSLGSRAGGDVLYDWADRSVSLKETPKEEGKANYAP